MTALLLPIIPVVAAGIANLIVGYVWYHPKVFGGAWMRLTNITPEMAEQGKRRMPLYILVAFIAATFAAYMLNAFRIAWGIDDIAGAMMLAALTWLGFVAPAMLGSFLWEHKPFALYCINAGYWLASLVVMAAVLLL